MQCISFDHKTYKSKKYNNCPNILTHDLDDIVYLNFIMVLFMLQW